MSCSQNAKIGSAFKILAGKPTRKGSLRSPTPLWEDTIRINLKEIGISMKELD